MALERRLIKIKSSMLLKFEMHQYFTVNHGFNIFPTKDEYLIADTNANNLVIRMKNRNHNLTLCEFKSYLHECSKSQNTKIAQAANKFMNKYGRWLNK